MNALGIYLMVCLAFVICALVEFAITLVMYRRKESDVKHDTATESHTEKIENARMPQIGKIWPLATDGESVSPALNNVVNNNVVSRLMEEIRKRFSIIPASQVMDFLAFWIHLALFFLFNLVYWKVFW